ncbi:MAG: hypothetical protein ACUZ8O_10155 [Candidatus Anammoxibacter sp.]
MSLALKTKFQETRNRINRLYLLKEFLFCWFAFAIYWVCLGVVDFFLPFKELTLLFIFAGSLLVVFFYLIIRWILQSFSPPDNHYIAKTVEKEHTGLMDSLNASVNIISIPENQWTAFDAILIRKTKEITEKIDFFRSCWWTSRCRRDLRNRILISILLTVIALFIPVTIKSFYGMRDYLSGDFTGLEIYPGNMKIPVNSDLAITVNIKRGHKELKIEYKENGANINEIVEREGNGFKYYFYDVTEPLTYRLVTPDLTSPWYSVNVYIPPAIKSALVRVNAPQYTGLPLRETQLEEEIEVCEGSHVSLMIQTNRFTTKFDSLWNDQTLLPFERRGNLWIFNNPQPVLEAQEITLSLEDDKLHQSKYGPYKITVIPDLVPLVQILNPKSDETFEPDGIVNLECYIQDDYGIKDVKLVGFIGSLEIHRALNYQSDLKEQNVLYKWRLQDIDLRSETLISYYVSVTDNRTPEAQTGVSDLYFIEIAENQPEQKSNGDNGGGKGEEKIPIQKWISENKQIIKDIHRWKYMSGFAEKNISQLSQNTRLLRSDINHYFVDIRKKNEQFKSSQINVLITDLLDTLKIVEISIVDKGKEEADEFARIALNYLVKLYQATKKDNFSPGQGEESADSEAGDQSASKGDDGTSTQKPEKDIVSVLNDLQEDLNQLNDLIKNQEIQNIRISNGQLDAALIDNLKTNANSLEVLANGLNQYDDKLIALSSDYLDNASHLLMQLSKKVLVQDKKLNTRQSNISLDYMKISSIYLRNSLRNLSEDYFAEQLDKGRQLAEEQGSIQNETKKGNKNVADSLYKGQTNLNKDLISWMKKVNESLPLLNNHLLPKESAQYELSVLSELREIDTTSMQKSSKRAANALLYRLFKRAVPEQQTILNELSDVNENLAKFQSFLEQKSDKQYLEALKSISAIQASILEGKEGAMDGELTDLLRQLDGLHLTQSDPQFKMYNDNIQQLNDDTNNKSISNDAAGYMLHSTIRYLEQKLRELDMNDILSLNRAAKISPEKYKEQIYNYFKNLAETQY